MEIELNKDKKFRIAETISLKLPTSNPNYYTFIEIKQLFTGNLIITKTSELGNNKIVIIPVETNQIQIKGD